MKINGYDIEVIKKKIKNLHLYVLPPDGRLRVTCPQRTTKAQLERFVGEHREWIEANQAKLQAAQRQYDSEAFYLWGKKYTLQQVQGAGFSLMITGDTAVLTVPASATAERREGFLKEWYRAALKEEAARLLQHWEETTSLNCTELRTRAMTTRWGTCNTKTKRIWIALRLAKLPKEWLSYVLLHELIHTEIPNHSAAFKARLTQYMPEWRDIQKQMKNCAVF